MEIFDFLDYKAFVNRRIEAMPKKGYGQYRRMSKALAVNPVFISQVFRGAKELSLEQAYRTCRFLGLTDPESEHFLALVQYARASTPELKQFFKLQILKLKSKSQELKNRVFDEANLEESAKAIFYSNWQFSAVRLLSSVEGFESLDRIADRLELELDEVARIVEFLLGQGLLVREGKKLRMGPRITHLEAGSPYIRSRQQQWRLKGMARMDTVTEGDLFYTGPMVLSREVAVQVRKELVALIERVSKKVEPSASEELACLNVDWFRF